VIRNIDTQRTLDHEISACELLCRRALAEEYPDFADHLPGLPKDSQGCFELLLGVPYTRACLLALRRIKVQAGGIESDTPYAVERYVLLQAYLVALPRLRSLNVDDSVNRQFCGICRLVAAAAAAASEARLALGSDAFAELAQIVTFRRFHAGQLSFDIMPMPRAWLLRVHPFEVFDLIREIIYGFGGRRPVIIPHVDYWRANPLFLTQAEQERALRRIVGTVERQPMIKGLVSSSWLYCAEIGKSSPHLAWVRQFFLDNNAYIIDGGPTLIDAGFLLGSEKRRQLHAQGKLRPRETLVLWRRADMLAWATNYREAGRTGQSAGGSSLRNTAGLGLRFNRDTDANRLPRSGRFTLIDCKRWLYYKPWRYIFTVLLLPAVCAAILVSAAWTSLAALPVFVAALFLMWLFQYFFLQ
jgi:hypothetical protein